LRSASTVIFLKSDMTSPKQRHCLFVKGIREDSQGGATRPSVAPRTGGGSPILRRLHFRRDLCVPPAESTPPGPACPVCGRGHAAGKPCPSAAAKLSAGATLALGAPSVTPLPEVEQPVDPVVGSTVGSFRVVRPLGRGGMGSVYLAEHPVIGSKVAIKFLHESMASSADLVGRFYDEARAVNLIGHENIVGIYDLSLLPPSRYYIVMEYLDGDTLTALLRRGPVDPRVAVDILLQLCDALQCAHERGVVHRDLKPDNVFLLKRRGRDHFVKLVDFGIAKLRDVPGAGSHTAAGMIVGTPEYMSPEQCDNRPVDSRTDLYALGVMAYELVTGRLPFSGRSIAQLLIAHLKEPPIPPRQVNPSVHPALAAAIERALAKRPEDRFPDMAACASALAAALEELTTPASPPAAAGVPPGAATAVPSPAAIAVPPPAAAGPFPSPAAIAVPPPAAAGPVPSPAAIAAPPPPVAAPAVPALKVEVRTADDPAPRRLAAAEISRGGMYLVSEGSLPPLFSRVRLAIVRPQPERPLALEAEVVRLVTPADAATWKMAAGFAVQFVGLSSEQRAAVARLCQGSGAGQAASALASAALDDTAVAEMLRDLHGRAAGTHYEFLGLPPDAEFVDVRSGAKALRARLEALRGRKLAPEQAGWVGSLLERIERAAGVLAVPAERLSYDARRGNHLGVARCISAGLPVAVIESRRREHLAERPGNEERAQQQLSRANVARAMGNLGAARAAYEAALATDPLNLAAHKAYWSLRREVGEAETDR
jgi:serine/threonine-protein kinase